MAIRTLLEGERAGQLRRNGEEIAIRFVTDTRSMTEVDQLMKFDIASPLGMMVPLSEIADLRLDHSPNMIKRVDRLRDITIKGKVVGRDLGTVMDDIKQRLDQNIQLPPGYSIDYTGQKEQMDDAFYKLTLALIMAVLLVYMIMAAQFESLFYPFIIMFSLPITATGVMIGLLVTGRPLGVGAMIGLLILAGIVVNNAIVLIDYTNTLRKRGMSSTDALIAAGPVRLRPILMTTLTTILGLVPLMLSRGDGSEIQSPMAIVIIFGLIFSTVVTLLFVPVMYSLLDQGAAKLREAWHKRKGERGDELHET
jgi:HAE1 family hydrophobic/amphiphilic exporter-1